VIAHNDRRRLHKNTPDQVLNLDIACQAKLWGDHLAATGRWEHAPRSDRRSPHQGENLAMSKGTAGYLGELVPEEGWYEREIGYYDYSTGRANGGAVGHFTQMVWDVSTELGCAESRITSRGEEKIYSVCRYSPGGNVGGTFTEHVHRPY